MFCEAVTRPEQMPRLLEIAIQTAIARSPASGAHPARRRRACSASTRGSASARQLRSTASAVARRTTESREAAHLLNRATKVTILAGAGCRDHPRRLIAMADRLAAPVVHAMRGKEFIEHDNPFDVGMTGLLGFSSGYLAMKTCDTLLMLGTDFPYPQFYPGEGGARFRSIIRGEQLGRRTRLDLGLVGDVRTTLAALTDAPHEEARTVAPRGVAGALSQTRAAVSTTRRTAQPREAGPCTRRTCRETGPARARRTRSSPVTSGPRLSGRRGT